MIIDDEVAVGKVLGKMLSRLGYLPAIFRDSLEAVKAFRENPNCCDLVLTDMTMPSMTGSELAHEMLARRPDLPIILLSGYSESIDKEKALRIGIREFLYKPVKKETLSAVIREVLAGGKNSHS
jgi:CheY-like chemotaxis protein